MALLGGGLPICSSRELRGCQHMSEGKVEERGLGEKQLGVLIYFFLYLIRTSIQEKILRTHCTGSF